MITSFVRLLGVFAAIGMVALLASAQPHSVLAAGENADSMALDMDPFSSPTNTATSLGSIESCARIVRNDVQDADEDEIDMIVADLTISGIPASYPMFAYGVLLSFDESALTVEDHEGGFLLASAPGSNLFDASDPTPDLELDNYWLAAEADMSVGAGTEEVGSGVLQRVTFSAKAGASPGLYEIIFPEAAHIGIDNVPRVPDAFQFGQIAVDYYCPGVDYDGDGVWDLDEDICAGVPLNAALRPERIDGPFAGVDDDGDTLVDEPLPSGAESYDCDGDGYSGEAEDHVFSYKPQLIGDQKTCQEADTSFPDPEQPSQPSLRWPADTYGTAGSANKIDVQDITSFLAPIRYLDTDLGTRPGDVRWDLVPGNSGLLNDINIVDLNSVSIVEPAMLGGVRAYGGPPCPWSP